MKSLKVYDIVWDIDLEEGETYQDAVDDLGLPEQVDMVFHNDEDAEDSSVIADALSDEFGFTVEGFLTDYIYEFDAFDHRVVVG